MAAGDLDCFHEESVVNDLCLSESGELSPLHGHSTSFVSNQAPRSGKIAGAAHAREKAQATIMPAWLAECRLMLYRHSRMGAGLVSS